MRPVLAALALAVIALSAVPSADARRRQSAVEQEETRNGRYMSLFNVVKFQNTPCTSTGNTKMTGTCLTKDECAQRSGGMASGNCASGFGVCCISTANTCGSTISNNCTYIQNPGYPTATTVTTCNYMVKQLSNICQIRLDYETFKIAGPNVAAAAGMAKCDIDSWTITGSNNRAPATPANMINANVPVICGLATGQHIYVDVGGTNTANLNIDFKGTGTAATNARTWSVKVSQIECDSGYLAPAGCTQYYTGTHGSVKSFNYDVATAAEYAHLPDQDYGICVRKEPGYCGLRWIAAKETKSFSLSGGGALANLAATGQSGCPNDYLDIPRGNQRTFSGCVNSGTTIFVESIDRYCGEQLACIRKYTSSVPIYSDAFNIHFKTDAQDTVANQNRGFHLRWQQTPCTSPDGR